MYEAIAKCNKIKNFEHNKTVFIKEPELAWEDALKKISQFTTEEKLGHFALKASKELPPDFKVLVYFITILLTIMAGAFFHIDLL